MIHCLTTTLSAVISLTQAARVRQDGKVVNGVEIATLILSDCQSSCCLAVLHELKQHMDRMHEEAAIDSSQGTSLHEMEVNTGRNEQPCRRTRCQRDSAHTNHSFQEVLQSMKRHEHAGNNKCLTHV